MRAAAARVYLELQVVGLKELILKPAKLKSS